MINPPIIHANKSFSGNRYNDNVMRDVIIIVMMILVFLFWKNKKVNSKFINLSSIYFSILSSDLLLDEEEEVQAPIAVIVAISAAPRPINAEAIAAVEL
ncbi:hypothetical protein HGT70_00955 [Rosenbergiella collisarenosi]|uniref:hypothetical protein n=1 Tax=Rosenbergiella collisarenosi TaxID=1544695 RepID=UPI001BD9C650|nr:hypothetical protein [Rosenbergiella collisarenosi]MBT0719855.1 hypothetical protein [Rosenbergiella collisarenosi]